MGKFYLKRVHMQAFGRFFDTTVGPFAPGMNVVYGKNEAGKTTLNAFVRGVLFGWEDARGSKNVYKPASAERSGSLIFEKRKAALAGKAKPDDAAELSRTRNADGLKAKPENAARIVGDIDKDTYCTVFALTSDELRGLGDTGDMTSRLLTAGSGTEVSPAQVLAAIDARIATYTSRAAAATHSFPNLKKQLDACRARLVEAREESDTFKNEDRERRELSARCDRTARDVAEANARTEELAALKADLERLAYQEEEAIRLRDEAQREVDAADAAALAAINAGAARMTPADEAAVRDAVEREQAASDRIAHRVEAAQDEFSDARARYAAACESDGASAPKRTMPSFFVALALAAAGAAWVFAGSRMDSMLVSAVGLVCLIAAVVLAVALAVMSRPKATVRRDSAEEARRDMLEKKSVLESREAEALEQEAHVEAMLKSFGLVEAGGSLRRAIELMDAVRAARTAREDAVSRLAEAAARRDSFARAAEECRARQEACLEACGFDAAAPRSEVEAQAASASRRRDELTKQLEAQNRRLGELAHILAAAEHDDDLDILKTERAQIVTRQHESGTELARLLLARRMMVDAIRTWEGESQPEVYARASELMALMTEGAWPGVRTDEGGSICAVDAVGRAWEPRLLSLGTCQQLYLALRIALLECVEQVGSNLPVLADDILVNFDDDRRLGAVRALAELATKRQVIIFTCHKEVVDLIVSQAEDCKVLGL